jgi:Domain of unknown function (DUF4124)
MNIIPSVTRSVVIGLGLIVASTGAHAKVYRCVVNGNTTYSDRPCEGTDSETVNMVAPSAAKAGPAVAKATPAVESPADKPAVTTRPVVAAKFTASSPVDAPPAAAAAGKDWHLAGEYSDRVRDSSRTLKRASYGIECSATRRRPFVYAINGRYSLTAPSRSGNNQLQGPFYDSLDAAATAACAAK